MRRRPALLCAAVAAVAVLAGCGGGGQATAPATGGSAHPSVPPTQGSITGVPVRTVSTTDGAVSYRETGTGPPLLLIMGFGGTMDAWDPTFVDALAATHRVITFDNAGVGRTSPLPGPLTITAMAEQTAAFVRALHLTHVDVLGWSMGGMIAQALTVTHPDLVGHLVLAATLPGNGHATLPSAAVTAKLASVATDPAALLSLLFPPGATDAEHSYVAAIATYPDFSTPTPAVLAQQGQALASWATGQEPAGQRIGTIRAPTFVADGTDDQLVPPANSTTLAHTIPGARLQLYDQAAHAFLFQDEAAFVPAVTSFLG
ncbi:MAG TPA: alpha/beta hydrolase [Mycobacteriales bacterium]